MFSLQSNIITKMLSTFYAVECIILIHMSHNNYVKFKMSILSVLQFTEIKTYEREPCLLSKSSFQTKRNLIHKSINNVMLSLLQHDTRSYWYSHYYDYHHYKYDFNSHDSPLVVWVIKSWNCCYFLKHPPQEDYLK